jgi:hypothetical protein
MIIRNPTPAQLARHRRMMRWVAILGAFVALVRLADWWILHRG